MDAKGALGWIDKKIGDHLRMKSHTPDPATARHLAGVVKGLQLSRRVVARLIAAEKRHTRGLRNRGGLTP